MTICLTFLCAPGGDATLDPVLGDAPLSECSLRKAGAAAEALPPHGPTVRAPSVRCTQTADALGLAAVSEPALRDLGLGEWCGRTVDDVAATDPDGFTAWLTDPDAAPHEGESVRRLCRRTADWLSFMEPATGHTVAITEAAVIRAALIHALGVPARAFWHLTVPPLSTVTLTWRGGHWDVRLGYVATAREVGRGPASPRISGARSAHRQARNASSSTGVIAAGQSAVRHS
ncbi:histidine phosphatase family protein [Streptomyces sp. HUAS TT20]|uniref:histidine phosphatase family protein n=1 Tax=Streptomyces sp. HUAS TT20 TaxID=3447509 RepID=UPI0021D80882|nr:histidine phosphatase family protein [Streptomyces sp. HUAS 15-9]UXY30230.1 histidine phosphatase family protein [Streptomyces sp. HUAS 15-9]